MFFKNNNFNTAKILKHESGAGFTIIEMIVVVAVFLFIVGAALGIFISLIQNQKRVLAQQQILNQVSYIEEYMSKAMRMAKKADTADCIGINMIYILTQHNSLYNGIKFINQSNLDSEGNPICQEFFLDGVGTTGNPYVLKESKNSATAVDLTASSNLHIKNIKFAIDGGDTSLYNCGTICGASGSDIVQPRVTVLMSVFLPNGIGISCTDDSPCKNNTKCDTVINQCQPIQTFQTTISQRNLNSKEK